MASAVFDAVDEVKATHPGDVVTVTITAVADVITAPVAPGVPVARRKTHEVLVDALAAGIELNTSAHRPRTAADEHPQRINITEEEDDDSNIRGGRGGGAGAVSAVFHGVSSSVGVNVREHPTRGFYAEGCVELVAEDKEDCARLCSLALDGFRVPERSVRESGRATSALAHAGSGSFAGERVHCLLTLRITRRSGRGRLDECGVWLPESETTSEITVADLASIDRAKGSPPPAEDAALKAFARCVDALADSRSHVPYRDSKFTRLTAKALSGVARLFAVVCVSRRSSRHDESDAALQFARKIRRGVRATGGRGGGKGCGVVSGGKSTRLRPDHRVAYAAECERLDALARDLAETLGVSLSGLTSGAVALDMESGDDLLRLRDALAEGERLRAEVGRREDRAERSRRVRERFLA